MACVKFGAEEQAVVKVEMTVRAVEYALAVLEVGVSRLLGVVSSKGDEETCAEEDVATSTEEPGAWDMARSSWAGTDVSTGAASLACPDSMPIVEEAAGSMAA